MFDFTYWFTRLSYFSSIAMGVKIFGLSQIIPFFRVAKGSLATLGPDHLLLLFIYNEHYHKDLNYLA